jgi:predicted ATPase
VEQTLLEAASVAGREFAVAAIAAAVDWTIEDVETRCATLARRGQFLHVCGTDAWPDGPIATRYGFIHDVYRETLYEQVPCGRRARWHLQIGVRLEVGYGTRGREVAAELAEHFVRGQDTARAVQYLQYASEASPRQSSEKPQESPRASSCFVPLWVLHSSVETAKATPWGVVPGRGDQERADVHGILIPAVQR